MVSLERDKEELIKSMDLISFREKRMLRKGLRTLLLFFLAFGFNFFNFTAFAEIYLSSGDYLELDQNYRVVLTTDANVIFMNDSDIVAEISNGNCKLVGSYDVCITYVSTDSGLIGLNYSRYVCDLDVNYEVFEYGMLKKVKVNFNVSNRDCYYVDANIKVINALVFDVDGDVNSYVEDLPFVKSFETKNCVLNNDEILLKNHINTDDAFCEFYVLPHENATLITSYSYYNGYEYESGVKSESIVYQTPKIIVPEKVNINTSHPNATFTIEIDNPLNTKVYVLMNISFPSWIDVFVNNFEKGDIDFSSDKIKLNTLGFYVNPKTTKEIKINISLDDFSYSMKKGNFDINGIFYVDTNYSDCVEPLKNPNEYDLPTSYCIYLLPFSTSIGLNKNASEIEVLENYVQNGSLILRIDSTDYNLINDTLSLYQHYLYHPRLYFESDNLTNVSVKIVTNFLLDFDWINLTTGEIKEPSIQRSHDFSSRDPDKIEIIGNKIIYYYNLTNVMMEKLDDFYIFPDANFTLLQIELDFPTHKIVKNVSIKLTRPSFELASEIENDNFCVNIENPLFVNLNLEINFSNRLKQSKLKTILAKNSSLKICNEINTSFDDPILDTKDIKLWAKIMLQPRFNFDLLGDKFYYNLTKELTLQYHTLQLQAYAYAISNDLHLILIPDKTLKWLYIMPIYSNFVSDFESYHFENVNAGKRIEFDLRNFCTLSGFQGLSLFIIYNDGIKTKSIIKAVDIINKDELKNKSINKTSFSVEIKSMNSTLPKYYIKALNNCTLYIFHFQNLNNITLNYSNSDLILEPKHFMLPIEYVISKNVKNVKVYDEKCIKEIINSYNTSSLNLNILSKSVSESNFEVILTEIKSKLNISCNISSTKSIDVYNINKIKTKLFLTEKCNDYLISQLYDLETAKFNSIIQKLLPNQSIPQVSISNYVTMLKDVLDMKYLQLKNQTYQLNQSTISENQTTQGSNLNASNENQTNENQTNEEKNVNEESTKSQNQATKDEKHLSTEEFMKQYYKSKKSKTESKFNLLTLLKNKTFVGFIVLVLLIFVASEVYNGIKKHKKVEKVPELKNDEDKA